MNKAKQTGNWLLKHRCMIFIVFFIVEIVFIDNSSLLNRYQVRKQRSELRAELQKYRNMSYNDSVQLKALEDDPAAIEKIARERYFMKKADEDVFVIEYSGDDASANYGKNETVE